MCCSLSGAAQLQGVEEVRGIVSGQQHIGGVAGRRLNDAFRDDRGAAGVPARRQNTGSPIPSLPADLVVGDRPAQSESCRSTSGCRLDRAPRTRRTTPVCDENHGWDRSMDSRMVQMSATRSTGRAAPKETPLLPSRDRTTRPITLLDEVAVVIRVVIAGSIAVA